VPHNSVRPRSATEPSPRHLAVVPPSSCAAETIAAGDRYSRRVKPVIEWSVALVLVVLTAPILLVALAAVRVALGPEVLLRQQRVGKDGRVFTMFKVRTMLPDRRWLPDRRLRRGRSGTDRRLCHKRDDDPRHTPLGRLLRKYSIDEIPQLWNVLRGEMSLIGPRPELVGVVAGHDLWDHPRHQVRPGITGPWQISEFRSAPLHLNMHLDVAYVAELSWRTDLGVLRGTIGALLHPRGH